MQWIEQCYKREKMAFWMLNCTDAAMVEQILTDPKNTPLKERILRHIIFKSADSAYCYIIHISHEPISNPDEVFGKNSLYRTFYDTLFITGVFVLF